MYILSQNDDTLLSTDNLLNIYICEGGKTVKAQFVGGIFSKIGSYRTSQGAETALVGIFNAIDSGKQCFKMPKPDEVEYASGGGAHVKTKARLHGGS